MTDGVIVGGSIGLCCVATIVRWNCKHTGVRKQRIKAISYDVKIFNGLSKNDDYPRSFFARDQSLK